MTEYIRHAATFSVPTGVRLVNPEDFFKFLQSVTLEDRVIIDFQGHRFMADSGRRTGCSSVSQDDDDYLRQLPM